MKAKVEEMKEVVALLAKTEEEVFTWYLSNKEFVKPFYSDEVFALAFKGGSCAEKESLIPIF